MGYKALHSPEDRFSRDEYVLFDDFVSFTDAQLWTVAVAANGTIVHDGSVGRSHMEFFATTVHDAAVLATTHEIFKFIGGKAMVAEARIIFTDVDTDDGGVAFGFADAMAATTIADTTFAIAATDAALIYKVPDSGVWAFHTEINGTSVASTSTTTAGGSSHQTLRIDITPRSSTVLEARPFVDGVQLVTTAGVPIKHDITLGTATDLDFGMLIKSNDAADWSVFCDYLYAAQVRS